MTYKEFVKWCNQRACDGRWGSSAARLAIDVIPIINEVPFWKREKIWQKLNAWLEIEEQIVKPIEEKIKELANG